MRVPVQSRRRAARNRNRDVSIPVRENQVTFGIPRQITGIRIRETVSNAGQSLRKRHRANPVRR